jgi:hypothetical protein
MEVVPRPAPSFEEQIAHAQTLLKWQHGRHDHPPRQLERFAM